VAKHAQLPPLNVIGQQFFAQPYFRIVLFHFTMDDSLMNTRDTGQNNATISFDGARRLDIPLPFDESQTTQPPLCIQCFLCSAIVLLSKLPTVRKRAPVSDAVVARRITGLRELRTEVTQLQKRCKVLNNEVTTISQTMNSQVRPQSTMQRARWGAAPLRSPPRRMEPPDARGALPRVNWAPEVLELAKRLQAMKQNRPSTAGTSE
jgi:hypothetical protein